MIVFSAGSRLSVSISCWSIFWGILTLKILTQLMWSNEFSTNHDDPTLQMFKHHIFTIFQNVQSQLKYSLMVMLNKIFLLVFMGGGVVGFYLSFFKTHQYLKITKLYLIPYIIKYGNCNVYIIASNIQ